MKRILVLKTVRNKDLSRVVTDIHKRSQEQDIYLLTEDKDKLAPSFNFKVTEIKRPNGMLDYFKLEKDLVSQLRELRFDSVFVPVYKFRFWFYRHPLRLARCLKAKETWLLDLSTGDRQAPGPWFYLKYSFLDTIRFVKRSILKSRFFLFLKKTAAFSFLVLYMLSLAVLTGGTWVRGLFKRKTVKEG